MRWLAATAALALALTLFALQACEEVEQVLDSWRPDTPHEEYLAGLHAAGLAGTALSQAWILEAADAVRHPVGIELPFREETFIGADTPDAVGYRFRLERGQKIRIALEVRGNEPPRVFLDFFRMPEDPSDPPRPVQNAERTPSALVYEPNRAGDYLVRVQPELLRSGRFRLTIELEPALAFPVEGRDPRAIQSFFGADRDAGRRSHHGVDIFAPRGTPVLASADGRVTRANLTTLGGKVVWLRDARKNRNLYYAHLDSQVVQRGMEVTVGDTLGFVGNTGNARTTPPHLHYGIYYGGEGPVDPLPFLVLPPRSLPEQSADLEPLGRWGRSVDDGSRLRVAPASDADLVRELSEHTAMRIAAAAGGWYRVTLPDETTGYVVARRVEDAAMPFTESVAVAELASYIRPTTAAPMVDVVAAGTPLPVIGRFDDFQLVRLPSGRAAWVRLSSS